MDDTIPESKDITRDNIVDMDQGKSSTEYKDQEKEPIGEETSGSDDPLFSASEMQDMVSDSALKESLVSIKGAVMHGALQTKPPPLTTRKDRFTTEYRPFSWADVEKVKPASSSVEYVPEHSHQSEGPIMSELIGNMSDQMSQLQKTVELQQKTIDALVKSNVQLTKDMDTLRTQHRVEKNEHAASVRHLEEEFKKRINDAVHVHKDTPELIDRILQATQQLISYLPEESKKGLQKIELTPAEQHTLDTVRTFVAPKTPRLPKHLR